MKPNCSEEALFSLSPEVEQKYSISRRKVIVDDAFIERVKELAMLGLKKRDIAAALGLRREYFFHLRQEYPFLEDICRQSISKRAEKVAKKVDWWMDSDNPAAIRLLEKAAEYYLGWKKESSGKPLKGQDKEDINKFLDESEEKIKALRAKHKSDV